MGEKSHYEINIFLQYTSATINHTLLFSTFCNLLFCQDNSSESSPIMPDTFGEHLTRDQRPFLHPESLRSFDGASSLQFTHSFSTGFRSEDWDGNGRSLVLFSVTYFCFDFDGCLRIIVLLEDPTMAHYKISSIDC